MNQRPANEHLSAWLDGELDEAEGALLEAELARDPELRAELQSLEAVVRLLREEGPTQAPLGFQHRVMARVEQEFPERSSWWTWLRRPWGIPLEGWVLGLAAAAALLLVLPIWRAPPASEGEPVELSPAAVELPRLEEPVEVAKEADKGPIEEDEKGSSKLIGRATTGEDSVPKGVQKKGVVEETATGTASEAPLVAQELGKLPVDPIDPTSPYQVVVRSEDAGMKRQILAIAGRYGSGATDTAKQPITDSQMRSGTEELIVSLAQTDLASFANDVAKIGYQVETVNQDQLVGGTMVSVRLTLQLVGGGVEASEAAPPNAAHKQHDMTESADEN